MVLLLIRNHNLSANIKNRNREGGFSLLEVLLAILLLGTGLAVLLQVISTGLFAGSVNENEIIATSLVQEKIEELRNASFASIISEAKAAVSGFSSFSRKVDVTTPQTNLDQITVTVYWYAGQTETSLSMVTYVSNI